MRRLISIAAMLLCSTAAVAEFRHSYQVFSSGIKVFATNTDDRPHNCNISYVFYTENSPGGQTVNTSTTVPVGVKNVVIQQTTGGGLISV